MTRDWTPSDQADAAESEHSRQWWKRNPYADPDYRANDPRQTQYAQSRQAWRDANPPITAADIEAALAAKAIEELPL